MMRARLGALGLAVLCLAGCASLRSAPPVRTFRLTYRPPEPSGAAPLPATVRVMPFGIVSAYDSQAFLYRTGPYDVGIDYYNRWVGNPSTMITDLVARDLEGRFPSLEIRFVALNGGTHGRMHINSRQDAGSLTGRIFELGEIPDTSTTLVKDLSRQASLLVRQEIQLAKTEVAEKGKSVGTGAAAVAAAAVAGLLALGALTAFLVLALDGVMPAWTAALVVTLAWAAVGVGLALYGREKLREAGTPVPEKTIETLKEDMEWIRHPTS